MPTGPYVCTVSGLLLAQARVTAQFFYEFIDYSTLSSSHARLPSF